MKNAFQFMPMFWEDYIINAGYLSTIEHGAYQLLRCRYWTTAQPIPDDDALMADVVKMALDDWRKIKPRICAFFVFDDGFWRHEEIESLLEDARARSEINRANATKRWGNGRLNSPLRSR